MAGPPPATYQQTRRAVLGMSQVCRKHCSLFLSNCDGLTADVELPCCSVICTGQDPENWLAIALLEKLAQYKHARHIALPTPDTQESCCMMLGDPLMPLRRDR